MSRWRRWQREHGQAPVQGSAVAGSRRRFQVEDFVLAAWVLAIEAAVARFLGSDPSAFFRYADGSTLSGHAVVETAVGLTLAANPLGLARWWSELPPISWMGWATLAGLAAVVFTRGREDTTVDEGLTRRILVTGPLYYALALGVAMVSGVRGRPNDGGEPPYPGFTTPPWFRRAAVVPAALLGQAAFRAHAGEFLALDSQVGAVQMALETVLLLAGFALCVAGPRIAAGATRQPLAWVPRFVLFAGAALASRWVPL